MIILTIIILWELGSLLYLITKGKVFKGIYHDIFGWHIPKDKKVYRGCLVISECKICGQKVIRDSQGNWF